MWFLQLVALYLVCAFGKTESSRDTNFLNPFGLPQPDVCSPAPKGRVPWILYVRDSDYGWREHTHRAMIALAVNEYKGNEDEMRKMDLQLEVELTRALFRNKTHPIHESDLALYIHALLATNKNPRNFHGNDLVADLLRRVESSAGQVNPFLVLALCNAHAVEFVHLERISRIAGHSRHGRIDENDHPDVDSREIQRKALAYKALACAIKYHPEGHKFTEDMKTLENCLRRKYISETGSFGNVFTTSLAVQAFTTRPPSWWDERKSLQYLEREAEIDVNLIKAYYIEMALNANRFNFIRDLYEGIPEPGTTPLQDTMYVQYTIKKSRLPEKYFSLTLKVENGTNFYEIMKIASNASSAFNFTAYINKDGNPMVYSVAGVPNDIEENMFWRLCRQSDVDHNRHSSLIEPFDMSPVMLVPKKDEHLIYLYSRTDCPTK